MCPLISGPIDVDLRMRKSKETRQRTRQRPICVLRFFLSFVLSSSVRSFSPLRHAEPSVVRIYLSTDRMPLCGRILVEYHPSPFLHSSTRERSTHNQNSSRSICGETATGSRAFVLDKRVEDRHAYPAMEVALAARRSPRDLHPQVADERDY
jgi:hypothetical protein